MMITENPRHSHLSWVTAVRECRRAYAREEYIGDDVAQTIAAAYMAPVATSWNMTALAQGRPFDTDGLRAEIDREEALADSLTMPLDEDDRDVLAALRDWVNGVESRN